jgi:hypothetical protein
LPVLSCPLCCANTIGGVIFIFPMGEAQQKKSVNFRHWCGNCAPLCLHVQQVLSSSLISARFSCGLYIAPTIWRYVARAAWPIFQELSIELRVFTGNRNMANIRLGENRIEKINYCPKIFKKICRIGCLWLIKLLKVLSSEI